MTGSVAEPRAASGEAAGRGAPASAFEVEALSGAGFGPVSLSLDEGRCLGVSGPSGSGKSRLLRAVADLDPHEGTVRLDGVPCERLPPTTWRRRVGLLAAESHWWRDRVAEHFFSPPSPAVLSALGLEPGVLDEPVGRLSSGQRQRLALLRLLANEPRVLLLDEPTANLDADNARRVERLIREYLAERRAMALWVSHDAAQIRRVARAVLTLEGGRARLRGAPAP